MPVNMKALRKSVNRRKPVAAAAPVKVAAPEPAPAPAPAPEPAPAPAPEPVVEAAPEPELSMDNTKAELVAAAEAAGIEIKGGWTKADILAALEA